MVRFEKVLRGRTYVVLESYLIAITRTYMNRFFNGTHGYLVFLGILSFSN